MKSINIDDILHYEIKKVTAENRMTVAQFADRALWLFLQYYDGEAPPAHIRNIKPLGAWNYKHDGTDIADHSLIPNPLDIAEAKRNGIVPRWKTESANFINTLISNN